MQQGVNLCPIIVKFPIISLLLLMIAFDKMLTPLILQSKDDNV